MHTLNEIYDLVGERAPVPKTGQTTSYADYDDGYYEKGVAWPDPRFTDNSDGTVTDNLTGLIWLKNADCFGTKTWYDSENETYPALEAANTLNSGECSLSDGSSEGDWRLPNVLELLSLIDWEEYDPALPDGHPFTSIHSTPYWSSTTYECDTDRAWSVRLSTGDLDRPYRNTGLYIWPVRGGQ